MTFMSSLEPRDRKLLLWFVGAAVVFAVAAGFLLPNGDNNENRLPSTYLSGRHGALAAFETLVRAGYPVERWERPLAELSMTAGPETVVVFAEPFTREREDIQAVRQILERGGRVLATGYWGGYLLPSGASAPPGEFNFAACPLEPEGLDALSSTGEVWMIPEATWTVGKPNDRVEYSCAGQPAVVEYDWGKGHVVWWASSTPLENGSLARAQNLDLLLNSLGTREGKHFYWDESLHGEIRSSWTYAGGLALTILRIGVVLLSLLVLFSFSRRSGPVRELPPPVRATPVEFVEALGSLYRNAGASSTAIAIAWERFRRQALRLCGMHGERMDAAELAATLHRRFPGLEEGLEADLKACEEAAGADVVQNKEALRLVQLLGSHMEKLKAAAKPGVPSAVVQAGVRAGEVQSHTHERAS
jgi:Domain of unknown function (DUF4350)